MSQQKIVFFGGPGTGKTTVIKALTQRGYACKQEVSREIILEAKKQGINQLFLADPILFSEKLLEGRERQFHEAENEGHDIVFFDRGIPEVFGYMNFLGTQYPEIFIEKSKTLRYQKIIHFPIWKTIYEQDNERYESLEQAKTIDIYLQKAYKSLGYQIHSVPFGSAEERTEYILDLIQH